MKKTEKSTIWAFWVALAIVIGTHVYMIGFGLPANQMVPHAIINLVAGGLLLYVWYN